MSLGKGVVGEQPTLEEMKSVLSEWDAYMYCGHGANLKNVSLQVPLLFIVKNNVLSHLKIQE
jgi:hypothetical protein